MPRPSKRRKMARTVSINTILQRVGSKEAPLADVIGTAPQTVEDIVALQSSGNTTLTFPASPPTMSVLFASPLLLVCPQSAIQLDNDKT